jgi:hypothetical protein
MKLSKLTTLSVQSSEDSDQSSSKTWTQLKARLVSAIDEIAPGLPAAIKGLLASALAQGTDDEIRVKLSEMIDKLLWVIKEEPMDEQSSDES